MRRVGIMNCSLNYTILKHLMLFIKNVVDKFTVLLVFLVLFYFVLTLYFLYGIFCLLAC